MPYIWADNEEAFRLAGVSIYHIYCNDMGEDGTRDHHFSKYPYTREDQDEEFDIRLLPEIPDDKLDEVLARYKESDGDKIAKDNGLSLGEVMRLCYAIMEDLLPDEDDYERHQDKHQNSDQ